MNLRNVYKRWQKIQTKVCLTQLNGHGQSGDHVNQDRGGLIHVNDIIFSVFAEMELAL